MLSIDFPRELYELQYPAPGDPVLAARVALLLGERRASLRTDWGLEHGTWTVRLHLLPAADCPVVQLSNDDRLPAAEHLALGRADPRKRKRHAQFLYALDAGRCLLLKTIEACPTWSLPRARSEVDHITGPMIQGANSSSPIPCASLFVLFPDATASTSSNMCRPTSAIVAPSRMTPQSTSMSPSMRR
jgi:hypothetical protein